MRALLAGVVVAGVGLGLLTACHEEERPICKFQVASFVESILTEDKGQVIGIYRRHCEYRVRFPAAQVFTDSRVLSDDGAISAKPLALVHMREFELRSAE